MECNKRSLMFLENLVENIMMNKRLVVEEKDEMIQELNFIKEYLEQIGKYNFKGIIDEFIEGIYITDGEGKTLYVNKAYLEMTELQKEDVIDKNVEDLVKSGVFYNAVTPEVIKQKKVFNSIGKAKKGIDMLITGKPIFSDSGSLERVVVTQRDISKLTAVQKELEISQKKIKMVESITRKKKQEIEYLRRQQLNNNFIGVSEEMQEVVKLINKVSLLDVTVLITGESGAGKEVIANEIFRNSHRNGGPFIKVNASAIPENLLESELFGYEKGAFTGAVTSRSGLFELADQGTLFLDEIGDMPLSLQAKLLRAIQHKQITRIGGSKTIDLDVRIIAATNANLKKLVKEGKFREDLYYRLNVFPIEILPLRSRPADIVVLVEHFLNIYNGKYDKQITLDEEAISMIQKYSWPGNIRELQNIIERIVVISEMHTIIGAKEIASLLMINIENTMQAQGEFGLKEIVENFERELIKNALKEAGSTRKAAKILKISQSAVVKKAQKLQINLNNS